MIAKVRRAATSRFSFSTSTDMKPDTIAQTTPRRWSSLPGRRCASGATAQLGQPPAQADEQEAPVLQELGRLSFVGVTDELQDPADDEQAQRQRLQSPRSQIWAAIEQRDRQRDQGDPDGVAEPVHGVLMAVRRIRRSSHPSCARSSRPHRGPSTTFFLPNRQPTRHRRTRTSVDSRSGAGPTAPATSRIRNTGAGARSLCRRFRSFSPRCAAAPATRRSPCFDFGAGRGQAVDDAQAEAVGDDHGD